MPRKVPHEWLDAVAIKGPGHTIIKWADSAKRIRFMDSPFDPYYFLLKEDLKPSVLKTIQRFRGNIEKSDLRYVSTKQKKLVKVEVPYEQTLRTTRSMFEKKGLTTFESFIPHIRRIVWDKEINQCDLKDRCAFDIEVDARKGFPEHTNPTQRIISVGIVGSDGKEYFFADKDEKQLYRNFHELMRKKYHLMTGWNIRDFDLPYWKARAKAIGFKIPFTPIQEIDAMLNYQKASAWGFMGLSYKLDDVADRELGLSKIAFRTKAKMSTLWDSFAGDQKLLKEYNLNDARLVRKLDAKLRLSELYVTLSRFVKLLLRDAVWVSACAEALIMRELKILEPRIVFPRRSVESSGKLIGGWVMEPKKGMHFYSYHFDYTSLYNRYIQTVGLSSEIYPWFEEDFKARTGAYPNPEKLNINAYIEFMNRKRAAGELWEPILPKVLTRLEVMREDFKSKRDLISNKESMEYIYFQIGQTALKLIILGCWGIIGRKNARFYNLGCASDITLGCQAVMKKTRDIINSMGYDTFYADTDGIFFDVVDPLKKDLFNMTLEAPLIQEKFGKQLKSWFMKHYNSKESEYALDLTPRYVLSRFFMLAKKNYICRCVWEEGKYELTDKVAGIAMRRSDSFELLKEFQRKVRDIVMQAPMDEIEDRMFKYMSVIRRELLGGKRDAELIISSGTKKKINAYKGNSIQKRLVSQMLDSGAYRPGDDISWLICGKTPKGLLDGRAIIPGDDVKPKVRSDGYEMYWQRMVKFPQKLLGKKVVSRGLNIELGPLEFRGKIMTLDGYVAKD